jgi:hypothetical protein
MKAGIGSVSLPLHSYLSTPFQKFANVSRHCLLTVAASDTVRAGDRILVERRSARVTGDRLPRFTLVPVVTDKLHERVQAGEVSFRGVTSSAAVDGTSIRRERFRIAAGYKNQVGAILQTSIGEPAVSVNVATSHRVATIRSPWNM